MPILGNLSEFQLPEVLLLIGARTGRLRLLDVPEFGIMDLDLSNNEVQAMHLGGNTFTECEEMIGKLSAVVQAQGGMFEFRLHPVASVSRQRPLLVNQLVLSLVCHVDEQVARQRAQSSIECRYVLVVPQPEIWIEPELNTFFLAARQFFTTPGINVDVLAGFLNMDLETVHKNLTNLRLLGLVKVLDLADTGQLAEIKVQQQISRKSNDFLRASNAVGELKKSSTVLR